VIVTVNESETGKTTSYIRRTKALPLHIIYVQTDRYSQFLRSSIRICIHYLKHPPPFIVHLSSLSSYNSIIMDVSVVAAVGSFVMSERVLKPKATALFILGCILAYDLTTKTHDVSSLRVYRGKFITKQLLDECVCGDDSVVVPQGPQQ
jgi:hypothetical protein